MSNRNRPPKKKAESIDDWLSKLGAKREEDGSVRLSPEAIDAMREKRFRAEALSAVPSTPRYVMRQGAGPAAPKGLGRFNSLSMLALREIRERSPLLSAIHSARRTQITRLSQQWRGVGTVGWRVVHRDHTAPNAKVPASIKPLIDEATRLIRCPSPTYCPNTAALLPPLEEDLLTINRPVVERLYSIYDDRLMVGFRPVDGGIIWPTLVFLQRWLLDNPGNSLGYDQGVLTGEQALEVLSHLMGHDLLTAEYCLVREGIVERAYRPGQLIVAPMQTRTDVRFAGYPPGRVEDAAEILLNFMNTWEYNGVMFTRGMLAEFIIGVSGNVHDDDIDAFVDQLRLATQGSRRAWQPPILPLPEGETITKIDLKANNKDMGFETWLSLLIALTCGTYRMDPSTINAKPWDGGQGASLQAGNREQEIATAKEEGLQGDAQHLVLNILDPIVQQIHPDLLVLMETGDTDPRKDAEVIEIRTRSILTLNEGRMGQGLDPNGFWLSREEYEAASPEDQSKHDLNPWNMPNNPNFKALITAAKGTTDPTGLDETGADTPFGDPSAPHNPGTAPFGTPAAPPRPPVSAAPSSPAPDKADTSADDANEPDDDTDELPEAPPQRPPPPASPALKKGLGIILRGPS